MGCVNAPPQTAKELPDTKNCQTPSAISTCQIDLDVGQDISPQPKARQVPIFKPPKMMKIPTAKPIVPILKKDRNKSLLTTQVQNRRNKECRFSDFQTSSIEGRKSMHVPDSMNKSDSSRKSVLGRNRFTHVFQDGAMFQGQMLDESCLIGKLIIPDKTIYEGQFIDFCMEGIGKVTLPNGNTYEGTWDNGHLLQCFRVVYHNGTIYEGKLVNYKKNGHGIYIWTNGDRYQGEWKDGEMSGRGKWISNDKEIEGQWHNNKLICTTTV